MLFLFCQGGNKMFKRIKQIKNWIYDLAKLAKGEKATFEGIMYVSNDATDKINYKIELWK